MSKMDMVSTILLERGWSAVLHQPLPGAGVLAVELLQDGELDAGKEHRITDLFLKFWLT
jgi:hypothetical protein